MPKPPGKGGGPNQGAFDLNVTGPPPGDPTVGQEHWIELMTIPNNERIWFGNATYTSPDKAIKFELRTNITGETQGTEAKTTALGTTQVRPKTATKFVDYFKKGRLHITSVYGTVGEKVWLRLVAKGAAGSYMFDINYTTEAL